MTNTILDMYDYIRNTQDQDREPMQNSLEVHWAVSHNCSFIGLS